MQMDALLTFFSLLSKISNKVLMQKIFCVIIQNKDLAEVDGTCLSAVVEGGSAFC